MFQAVTIYLESRWCMGLTDFEHYETYGKLFKVNYLLYSVLLISCSYIVLYTCHMVIQMLIIFLLLTTRLPAFINNTLNLNVLLLVACDSTVWYHILGSISWCPPRIWVSCRECFKHFSFSTKRANWQLDQINFLVKFY